MSLFDAVKAKNYELVKKLIDEGADVNAKNDEGETALMIASNEGDKEICELLIEKGADVNAKDNEGNTALMYVSLKGDKEICELLIKNNAEVPELDDSITKEYKYSWAELRAYKQEFDKSQ